MSAHEPPIPSVKPKASTERSFGMVFAAFFALLGLIAWYRRGASTFWPFVTAAAFLAAALFAPHLLSPLNRLWFRFANLLHAVTTPLFVGLIYFAVIVPMGLVLRWFGHDPLRLRRDRIASSYWIARDPQGPQAGSMSKQF